MDRMGYPAGLIRYATENSLAKGYDAATMWKRVFRARTMVYMGLLVLIALAAGVSLALRNPLKVDVIRDRGALAREAAPGIVENVYRLQIMNTDEKPHAFTIRATGLRDLTVTGLAQPIEVNAASIRLVPLILRAPAEAADHDEHGERDEHERESARQKSRKVEIVVSAQDDASMERYEKSSFIFPRQ
jgi:polyferredoxin